MSFTGGLTKTLKFAKSALKTGANWFGNNATSLFGGLGSVGSAFMSYQAAKKLMDRQNKFTEYMSNTAHQREVNDLREAGLNPILSALGGSGATTPASGSGGSMSFENPMNSALAWRQQKNENKLADAEVDFKNENKELLSEHIHNAIVSRNNETRLVTAQIDNLIKQGNAALLHANSAYGDYRIRREIQDNVKAGQEAEREWIEQHPNAYKTGKWLQTALPGLLGIGAGVGAGASAYSMYDKSQQNKLDRDKFEYNKTRRPKARLR